MKIIFFGSDDFALTNLERIISSRHEVAACVTQPDRPGGRGLKILASPVKECARQYKLPVFQPGDLNEPPFINALKKYQSDLFVVIAYGKILPGEVLRLPRICSVNAHASLLPKYRGAAPVNWAVINGEPETGVSIIRMDEKMDAGDIISQSRMKIDSEDTAATLRKKLALLSADTLIETINTLERGQARFVPQDDAKVTWAPKLRKAMGLIDWRKSAWEINRLVRGLIPWPTAYTFYKGKLLKILDAVVVPGPAGDCEPGQVVDVSHLGLLVAAAKDRLLLTQVHMESSKAMDASSFASGHKVEQGCRLGKE